MLINLNNKLTLLKAGLTNLDSYPVGKSVLAIVLLLDLFILMSIFQGLNDHANQLTTPYQYIPQYCRDIVIDENWHENNRLVRTAHIVKRFSSRYVYADKRNDNQHVHPSCEPISNILHTVKKDKNLSNELIYLLQLREMSGQVVSDLNKISGAYNTSLLENITDRNTKKNNTPVLKKQASELKTKLNALTAQDAITVKKLNKNKHIEVLFDVIVYSSIEKKDALVDELRQINFWYPVKRLGMEMLFLIPLVIICYWWNSKSIFTRRPYQILVSSHLLVVVFIPVIFKLVELIYDILPRRIFINIFEALFR